MSQPTALLLALADFNDARLNEDEEAAKGATPGPWWYNPRKQWLDPEAFERYDLAKGEEFVGYGGPHPFTGAVAATGPASHPQSMRDAAFIARQHPARVLAEVAAKRLLIANWRDLVHRIDAEQDPEKRERLALTRHGLDQFAFQMAAIHAQHPDYQPGWAP